MLKLIIIVLDIITLMVVTAAFGVCCVSCYTNWVKHDMGAFVMLGIVSIIMGFMSVGAFRELLRAGAVMSDLSGGRNRR